MSSKYDYILLPPDGFHQTFEDLFSLSISNFIDLEKKLALLAKKRKKTFIVKYRTQLQKMNFTCEGRHVVSYGNLLNLCHKKTKVIGPCGTAMLEMLKKEIEYYSYDFVEGYKHNRMLHNNFSTLLHVARTPNELIINVENEKVFHSNCSIGNLIMSDGISLKEIVDKILYE